MNRDHKGDQIVSASGIEEMIKTVRLLARTGKKMFQIYLYDPLLQRGWKVLYSKENSKKTMERVEQASRSPATLHTLGPLCKRMISLALTENFTAVGDSTIFFLEKIATNRQLAQSREAQEFLSIIRPTLGEFSENHKNKSERIFEQTLETLSITDLKHAFSPVPLGEKGEKATEVKLEEEAQTLFERIKMAVNRNDIPRCRKLISTYLIKYADQEKNNRDEVERLIDAFQKRDENFRREIEEFMAINLYYTLVNGIMEGDLKKTVHSIRKYAHIFQGNPDVPYFKDIDSLEKKLYAIITQKKLWNLLKD